jgi:hypothetical protein
VSRQRRSESSASSSRAGRRAEIAVQLSVSEATVRTHLTHVYAKLGVRGRHELLARAVTEARSTTEVGGRNDPDDQAPGPTVAEGWRDVTLHRAASATLAALGAVSTVLNPKTAAIVGPLLLVLGLGLPVRSGNRLDSAVRVGVLGLGLGLWLATVWLVLLADPS